MYPRRSGSKTSKYRKMDVGKRLAMSKLVMTRKKSASGGVGEERELSTRYHDEQDYTHVCS